MGVIPDRFDKMPEPRQFNTFCNCFFCIMRISISNLKLKTEGSTMTVFKSRVYNGSGWRSR